MSTSWNWNRRQFVAGAAAAAVAADHRPLWASQSAEPSRVMPPPGVITGGIEPLFESNTARPLRYHPRAGDFVIRNGSEFFNRPLYGPNLDFRVDAGDLPEFSLYLPGHGGNLKLGMAVSGHAKWLSQADEIIARYRPGRMIYEIRDGLLGSGTVTLELLTAAEGSGLLVQIAQQGTASDVTLTWAFGGVSGRKGRRNGDIGCETEPVSSFFQLRPEECADNTYQIAAASGQRPASRLRSPVCDLWLTFPHGSTQRTSDAMTWNAPVVPSAQPSETSAQPILIGWVPLTGPAPLYIMIERIAPESAPPASSDPTPVFAARSAQVAAIANTLHMVTPDPYIDASAGALAIAADAVWDARQQCVMHGAVAWRVPLPGWRGPYCLDSLGNHERAREHFRHWIARQNTEPITTPDPATGPWDANAHLSRKERLLHSNGDLSRNHYDMNLVFFDVLLRHLRWTGDLSFAREVWPAFQRHLAWEHRLFRRLYTTSDGRELPLYEAYAAIWASDNLQYNGGGAAHSSAYNLFALRTAAHLAHLLDEDPAPYEAEAGLLQQGMQELLWLPQQGAFAESKDILTNQTVYNNPALWTVYHCIDSEAATAHQSWQMVAERLAALRHVPIHGPGVPPGAWYMLSCSDWLPYLWSLNLLALAENIHFSLALWQAGMPDEAYALFKGNILDSMFQGLCPGNFHMSSQLDPHRQESQRDFADPIGIASRALIEGLFGVQPDLLRNTLTLRPGFPAEWSHAALQHPDFDLEWKLDSQAEMFIFTSRLPRAVPAKLILPARTTRLPRVIVNGAPILASSLAESIGTPRIVCHLPAAPSWAVHIEWVGEAPATMPEHFTCSVGELLPLPDGVTLVQLDDPQRCLNHGRITSPGFHTVFANIHQDDCHWSMPIAFTAKPAAKPVPALLPTPSRGQMDPIDLSGALRHRITDIFTRSHAEPRSSFCSLALPEQLLGGWANMNMTAIIDDTGLRRAGGLLETPLGVPFRTPPGAASNCLFLSQWQADSPQATIPLNGRAQAVYLLLTGATYPQASRMRHGVVTVQYANGPASTLALINPATFWPIEQDYLLDDYLFCDEAPLPARLDLRTGQTRILTRETFQGAGREVPGGAATILQLPLDSSRSLHSLNIEANLYGIVIALLAVTLVRPQ